MCGCRNLLCYLLLLLRTPILHLLLSNVVFAYSRSMGGLMDQGFFNPPMRDELSRSSWASDSNSDPYSPGSMHSADNDTYLEEPSGQVTFPRLLWRSGGGVTLEVKGFGRKFRLRLRRVYSSDYDESMGIGGPRLYRGSGRGSIAAMEICGDAVKGEIFTRGEEYHFVLNPLSASQGCDLESGRRLTRRSESIAHILRRERGGLLLKSRWNSTDSSWTREQSITSRTNRPLGDDLTSRSSKDECESTSGSRYRRGCDRGPVVSASIRSPSIVSPQSRRRSSTLYVETAVFVDSDLFNYMEENFFPVDTEREVKKVVLAMINAIFFNGITLSVNKLQLNTDGLYLLKVELLYQDPSLGRQLSFVIKRLEILRRDPPTLVRSHDIDRYLASFCTWQSKLNVSESQKWDHALLLTGLDLYVVGKNGKINDQVVGLAPVGGMCTGTNSCTLNEGRHFESVYVVAHEIGHNLGMVHDGPNTGNSCDPSSHIMSPTLGSGKITWSHCSRKFLERFLGTAQSACLFNKPKPSPRHLDHNAGILLPGEKFDADQQCMLKYGRGSGRAVPLQEGICRDLQCRRDRFTWASSHPALEGTECGSAKWCRSGQCVERNSIIFKGEVNDITIDEGWSSWTECASACLRPAPGRQHSGSVGISYSTQKCNGQRGKRGSQLCQGSRRRYRTCHANQCASVPVMNVLDYAVDVCSRAQEVDETMTGVGSQRLSSDPVEACTVWCFQKTGGYKSRGWKFPDGTACLTKAYNRSRPSYCIDGACQEFIRSEGGDSIFDNNDDMLQQANTLPQPQAIIQEASRSWGPWRAATSLTCTGSPLIPSPQPSGSSLFTTCGSSCRFACMAPGSGLRLVERECRGIDGSCEGPYASIQLCIPETAECARLKTPFEHASQVCSGYREKVRRLSGLGMQISPSAVDPDRPCKVACQDESVRHRFYLVNGPDGWFPFGTECGRGVPGKKAFCVAGKCLDFGEDGVLLEHSEWQTTFRGFLHRRAERSLLPSTIQVNASLDRDSLSALIERLDFQGGSNSGSPSVLPEVHPSIDLKNPVHIQLSDGLHFGRIHRNVSKGQTSNSTNSGKVISSNIPIIIFCIYWLQLPIPISICSFFST